MKDKMVQKQYSQRALKDRLARYFVSLGGISVIIAILLIFFYLLHVVIPMFESAEITQAQTLTFTDDSETIYIGLEEQGSIGLRLTRKGQAIFFDTSTGISVLEETLKLPAEITSVASNLDRLVLGFANGEVFVLKYVFDLSYPEDIRTITPRLEYPLGKELLTLDPSGKALTHISFQLNNEGAGLVATTSDNRLVYSRFVREESFISEEITTELESRSEIKLEDGKDSYLISSIALEPGLSHIYVASDKRKLYDYSIDENGINETPVVFEFDQKISNIRLLLGGSSLLIGLETGEVQQWMPVRIEGARKLTYIRSFDEGLQSVSVIETEQRRKGFAVADNSGAITLYYSTSQRTLAHIDSGDAEITQLAWSARAQHLLAVDKNNKMYFYQVHNEYPEVSWDVLWGKVWYEGYDEPDYIWQSSASTNEFEPKFSLVPLSFGTIKAAFLPCYLLYLLLF